jgi:hypothetical protein
MSTNPALRQSTGRTPNRASDPTLASAPGPTVRVARVEAVMQIIRNNSINITFVVAPESALRC